LSVGDDQWAYQKVGREDWAHLLKKPMSAVELQALLEAQERSVVAPVPPEPTDPPTTQAVCPGQPEPVLEKRRSGVSKWLVVGLALIGVCFVCGVVSILVGMPASDQ
jgi:hypothetical protein